MTADLAPNLKWDARLPLDIAINESSVTKRPVYTTEQLLNTYGIDQAYFDVIRSLPAFRAQVREAIQEIQNNGLTVKRKATALFEFYIDETVPLLMNSSYCDAKTKLDIIKFLGQVAQKDGKTGDDAPVAATVAAPTLNIILQQHGIPSNTVERVISEQ